MKLQLVPAHRGALWVRQGFGVFFAQPLAYMGLFGVYLLIMLVTQLLPWVGPLVFLSCLPQITLGFMIGTQRVLAGLTPTHQVFSIPLHLPRPHTASLWKLGGLYALLMFGVDAVRLWIDQGHSAALQAAWAGGKATPESVAAMMGAPQLQLGLLWFAVAWVLLSLPFWHAPGLILWGGMGVRKALFFSTVACWRNKGAFAIYGLTWLGVIMAFGIASSLIFALLGQPQWAALSMMPAVLMFWAVFYASLFFTFADCFEKPPQQEAAFAKPPP